MLPTQEPTDNDDGVVNQDADTSSSIHMEATESSLEPTGRNSLCADLEFLATLVKEQEKEISNLRYDCSSLREQLGSAKATVRKLQAEKEFLASRLAEKKKGRLRLPSNISRTPTKTLCSTVGCQDMNTSWPCFVS